MSESTEDREVESPTPMTLPQMQGAAERDVFEAEVDSPFANAEGVVKTFDVDSEVDFAVLDSEIEEALGVSVQLAMHADDIDSPISSENKGVLFVLSDGDFDGRTVRGVITSHAGPSADVAQGPSLDEALERLRAGEDLDLASVNLVLRSLV